MLKKTIINISVLSTLIFISGCSDKPEQLDTSDSSKVKEYSELTEKKNLSYFLTPENIAGQIILRTLKSPLSDYEKGLELGSDRDIRREKLNEFFKINKYNINMVASARINSKDFNEFEMDEFEQNLKKEFFTSMQNIQNNFKDINKHIKIKNLSIPVSYTKEGERKVKIKIENTQLLKQLNASKEISLSKFIKDSINNDNISKYIIDTNDKYNFEVIIKYDYGNTYSDYSKGLIVEGDNNILNEIGKFNKGNDQITELTLHAWDSRVSSRDTHTTKFVITSFKLKSSDKRFVSNSYVDLIYSSQSFNNKYLIKDNDVEMFIKNND